MGHRACILTFAQEWEQDKGSRQCPGGLLEMTRQPSEGGSVPTLKQRQDLEPLYFMVFIEICSHRLVTSETSWLQIDT